MSTTKLVGIIDEPVQSSGNDNLDINVHADSLKSFIEKTSTPITVGIQGEWGSGKTSLINSIYSDFDQNSEIKQIWINSWEYSLLSSPEEALLKIINKIIDELLEADKNKSRKDKIQKGAKKIFSGALRIGAHAALGKEAVNVANELIEGGEASIGALRNQLKELVVEIADRSSNPYKKIIIYVDDLDRIEPKNAVSILELLKNIFNVPHCVFILAIDYQVVVKGLEHKFGKQTAENEWEFRAFFDKIIQLPFMMPMGQYNIGKYVNSLLTSIGFVGKEGLGEEAVRQIIFQTIGGNPRSIKRLVNSVSLIQIFVETRKNKLGNKEEDKLEIDEEDLKFLLFSLVCLQIAFPNIYSLLGQEPDFQKWDDKFSFMQTNGVEERISDSDPDTAKKIFSQEFEAVKSTEDFDEPWEQALFKICYVNPRLKPRVADISKFLTYIKDILLAGQGDKIGQIISYVLQETSVTSVQSTDKGQDFKQSKYVTEEGVEVLREFRNNCVDAMVKAGSKIYKNVKKGNYFTWYSRFSNPKGIFNKDHKTIRWSIGFDGNLTLRCSGSSVEENQDFMKYIISKIPELEQKLPLNYGKWSFKYEEGIKKKQLFFNRYIDDKHYSEYIHAKYEGENWDQKIEKYFKEEENRNECIEWLTQVVVKFENAMIEMVNNFEKETGIEVR